VERARDRCELWRRKIFAGYGSLLSGCLQTTNTETPASANVSSAPPDDWHEIARRGVGRRRSLSASI
jgi:hypothetical protein